MKKLALMPAGAAAPREVPTDDGGVLGNVPLAAFAGAVGRGADVGGRRGRGVPKLAGVPTAAGAPFEVEAVLDFDHPWLATRCVLPWGLLPVFPVRGSGRSPSAGWGQRELGLEVEPIGPEWHGLRAAPVSVLADENRRGICVVVGGGAVHLQLDELPQPGHQLGHQRFAKGRDPLHMQTEGFGGLAHGSQQIDRELTDASGRRFVGDDKNHTTLVAEGV